MRKRHALVSMCIAALVVVAAIIGAGCGGKTTKTTGQQSTPSAATTQAETTPSTPSAKSTVGVFFVKGETVFVQVRRTVATAGPAEALKELLKGPSDAEKQQGLSTAIPKGTQLLSYSMEGTAAKVDFSKEMKDYGGGSATVQAIVNQVNKTVMVNDAAVKSVSITVAGVPSDESLQP